MSQSSPEGIILGKGSRLQSFDLSINKEKVISCKQEKSYTEEDLHNAYMQGHYLCLNGIETIDTAEECFIEWFEQLKNK